MLRNFAKNTAINLTVMLVATILSLIAGEAAWREMGHRPYPVPPAHPGDEDWGEPDREMGWVNKPGAHHSNEPGHALMNFTPAHARLSFDEGSKASASSRVVIVGCSATQGYGVTDDQTYAWALNQYYEDIRFDNFGTGAYDTYQSILMLKSVLSKKGDLPIQLVIYGFIDHHLIRNVAALDWIRATGWGKGYMIPPHIKLVHSEYIAEPARMVPLWPLETSSALVTSAHEVWLWRPKYTLDDLISVTEYLIQQMNSLSKDNGIEFLVVNLDRAGKLTGGSPTGDGPRRLWLEEYTKKQNIAYLDCSPPEVSTREFRVGGIGHPNGLQHERWARCIQGWIDNNFRR